MFEKSLLERKTHRGEEKSICLWHRYRNASHLFYLEENEEECEFSVEIRTDQFKEGENCPSVKTVKSRLLNKYGEDIFISIAAYEVPDRCFKSTGYTILSYVWYQ